MQANNGINLSYETAKATLSVIANYTAADFDTLGITQDDFNLASGQTVWRREHLSRVMRTVKSLMFGTLEIMGMPKIRVPAEYQAAIVASFVAPANRMACCIWLAQERQIGAPVAGLAAVDDATEQADVSAERLFALVIQLSETDASTQARTDFQKRLNLAADAAGKSVGAQ